MAYVDILSFNGCPGLQRAIYTYVIVEVFEITAEHGFDRLVRPTQLKASLN